MAQQKVPVEEIERTGLIASAIAFLVMTLPTIVAHFVDIVSGSCIGFRCQDATVGKLSHTDDVGLHYPVISIDKGTMKPVFNLLGRNTRN